jgi:hypothetical protein
MFLCGVAGFVFHFFGSLAFSYIGENITQNVRADLYASILKKHVGWHDNQENSSGVLSATLASDV